jgi:FKBP-type peptidyl-prolyl cis-trans isomerase SlyD
MSISKNKVVTLHYTLKEGAEDGPMIEETLGQSPLSFIFGIGQMIPGFEANLENKKAGSKYAFLLSPEEAYGGQQPNAIVDIPKSNFKDPEGVLDEEAIKVGNPVRMKNQEGRTFQGTIIEDKGEILVVDFNHPMAGKSLHFSGEIVSVREASAEEIAHGHVHDGTHH